MSGFRCITDVQTLTEGRILLLLEIVNDCGITHIVTGDGNMDKQSLEFVFGEMERGEATVNEWDLMELLASIPSSERDKIWEKHAYSWMTQEAQGTMQ